MLRTLALSILLACAGTAAHAAYPEKPIRMILPSAAGGSVDVLMRVLAQQLSAQMGVGFVVENKPGGAFVPGTMDIVRAAPDGYTLGYGNIVSLAINRALLPKLPYDVEKDLTLVSNCVQVFNMLAVSNDLPVRSVQELVAYAKKNPGKLTNGSSGNGTTGHLGGELFKFMTGTDIVHVPYKGGAAAINDLIGGRVQLMFESLNSIAPHARSGSVRALGVTGERRSPGFPDIPTVAEAGVPGYAAPTWSGVIGPAGIPRPIVDKLNAAINRAIKSPTFQQRFAAIGDEPAGGTPEEFAETIAKDSAKWREVVQRSGAKLD